MTPGEALQASITTMQEVIDRAPIADGQYRGPTPCAAFTVADLAEHIVDTHEFLLGAAGGTPVEPEGTLGERHRALGAASVARWSERGTEGTIDLGGNELPAGFGLSLHTLETYIHAWDLATSLGRPFQPSPALTEHLWDFARSFITADVRGDFDGAPYAEAVEIDETGDLIDRLIAHSGRDPRRPMA